MQIVLPVQMERMMPEETKDFTQDIITLHWIAGQIEREIGNGTLAEDLRKAADTLNELIKKK